MRRPRRDIGPRGEDIWEPAQSKAELIKLDPADVPTTKKSAKPLASLFKALASFDEVVPGEGEAVER